MATEGGIGVQPSIKANHGDGTPMNIPRHHLQSNTANRMGAPIRIPRVVF